MLRFPIGVTRGVAKEIMKALHELGIWKILVRKLSPWASARRTPGSNYGLVGAGCSLKTTAVKYLEALADNEVRKDTCSANKPTLCTNELSFLSAWLHVTTYILSWISRSACTSGTTAQLTSQLF
eukprot:TRINITY_DN2297_c1_g1_i1.p1 TRINITY_DN2297_c1_g1~~TRINITY_DN2297_c1_g1_i1.p1  ORF type:complete len:125 (+),score=5.44 TRINITY_DN2297_c1_g1_i1:537-911(+)